MLEVTCIHVAVCHLCVRGQGLLHNQAFCRYKYQGSLEYSHHEFENDNRGEEEEVGAEKGRTTECFQ